MSMDLRAALSDHDSYSPLSPAELLALADEMEKACVAWECNFSHPDWRYIDGLRALARQIEFPPEMK